jgi:phosphomevalonate kinase
MPNEDLSHFNVKRDHTSMRDLIAISGKQFSGKDLFANMLMEGLPEFRKVALARAIKIEFANLYGMTPVELEDNKALYRSGLITLGQRRRAQDPNYWLKKVLEVSGPKIVPDLRMMLEYECFKSKNAFLIRIEASRDLREQRGTLVQEADPTECELDNITEWDVVVENNGSIEDLRKKAKDVIRQIQST